MTEVFKCETWRFLREGNTGCSIHGLELWTVHKLILIGMLTWLLLVGRSVNILRQVLNMDIWHIKWDQNILLSFYLRYSILAFWVTFWYITELTFIKLISDSSDGVIFFFFHWFLWLQHLEQVIRQKIPSIIALINKTIDELNAELDRIGRPIAVDSGVRTETYAEFFNLKILYFWVF